MVKIAPFKGLLHPNIGLGTISIRNTEAMEDGIRDGITIHGIEDMGTIVGTTIIIMETTDTIQVMIQTVTRKEAGSRERIGIGSQMEGSIMQETRGISII